MSGATTLHRSAFTAHHGMASTSAHPSFGERLLAVWKMLETWQVRARQRRRLLELDDRLLRDIGISRADAQRLADRPFWKD